MSSLNAILAFFTSMPSWAELLIVMFAALLLFGKRLPDVARSLGQSIIEFKKGMQGFKDDLDRAGTRSPGADASATPKSTSQPQNALPAAEHPQSATPAAPAKQPVETND